MSKVLPARLKLYGADEWKWYGPFKGLNFQGWSRVSLGYGVVEVDGRKKGRDLVVKGEMGAGRVRYVAIC